MAGDISSTALPCHELDGLPRETPWEEVRLFTDTWTGISPVVVHHNAHRNGMKILRETWWPMVWFQKHLRALLDASGVGLTRYAAIGKVDGREYWPEKIWSGGGGVKGKNVAKVASSGLWLAYPDICGAYNEELFRDGSGWL